MTEPFYKRIGFIKFAHYAYLTATLLALSVALVVVFKTCVYLYEANKKENKIPEMSAHQPASIVRMEEVEKSIDELSKGSK